MIVFSLMAGVLIAGALLFLLPPLWRRHDAPAGRDAHSLTLSLYHDKAAELAQELDSGALDQDQYNEARRELEQRLLEDIPAQGQAATASGRGRWAVWALTLAVPLGAVGIYMLVGNPGAMQLTAPTAEAPAPGHDVTQQEVMAMIARLNERLQKNPNDAMGWAMMGRSYAALGRFEDALKSLDRAAELNDSDPDLLVDYADVLAVSRGKNLGGQPMELILKALALNPSHPKGLALAGTAAFNAKHYDHAIAYWEKLLGLMPPGSEDARGIARGIAEAKALAAGGEASQQAAAGASVSGVVQLNASLLGKVQPTDTLFVYARAAKGPPMPLAILRVQAKDLPLKFTLDDSMAIAQEMKLSSFPQVLVGARISRSGQAVASSGDLQGIIGPLPVGSRDVVIRIDSVIP